MKELITEEFIHYKSGFLAGKSEIVESFLLGKVINLGKDEQTVKSSDWYQMGYQDGFAYFCKLIDENKLNLENMNPKNIIQVCFSERVIKQNQKEGIEIPIGKFKL